MRTLTCVFALSCSITVARARLDDTPDQCQALYGAPVQTLPAQGNSDEGRVYELSGFRIGVGLMRGVSVSEVFSKLDRAELNASDIAFALRLESGNSTWVQDSIGSSARLQWHREDGGAVARCNPRERSVEVVSQTFLDALPFKGRNPDATGVDLTLSDGTVWHDIRFVAWDRRTVTLAHDSTSTRTAIKNLPPDTQLAVCAAQAAQYRSAPADQAELQELNTKGIRFLGKLTQMLSKNTALVNGSAQWQYDLFDAYLVGPLPADVVDGSRLDEWVWPAGRYQYTTVTGAPRTVQRFATSPELALALTRAD